MITKTVTQTITDTTTITTLLQTTVLIGSQPVETSPNMYDEQGDEPVTTVVTLTIPHLRILSRPVNIAGVAGAGGPVPTTVLDLNRVASSQSTGSHTQSTSSEETTTYTITRTVIQTVSGSI
jgi:hypothetical protein